ncbi:MAG: hypothetical protein V7L01_27585 [Nostoc sp.]
MTPCLSWNEGENMGLIPHFSTSGSRTLREASATGRAIVELCRSIES